MLQQERNSVAFFSYALGIKHQALSIYDKELLAALLAIKNGIHTWWEDIFVIKIDHQSLKFLSKQQAITPFQQRWVAKMLGYDYSIIYRRGTQDSKHCC